MFRKMRRFRQQLPETEAIEVLKNATSGTLALMGDDGYPYAVPMSHFYCDGKIYFHSAPDGHKIDAIRNCDKASFCVISRDEVVPEKFTTFYSSVIAFGRVRILQDVKEKVTVIRALSDKFVPNDIKGREQHIFGSMAGDTVLDPFDERNFEAMAANKSLSRLTLIELTIEHLTGKESIELTARRG